MLKDEWPALIGVAFQTLRLPEAAEQRACRGCMRIVTRRALECAFNQPMTLVELEICKQIVMAFETQPAGCADSPKLIDGIRRRMQQCLWRLRAMLRMAARARKAGLSMCASIELGVRTAMAARTNIALLCRRLVTKSENITGSTACADMGSRVAMTVQTTD
jgi:hypothetical protein